MFEHGPQSEPGKLQEGASEARFRGEMTQARFRLVVPDPLIEEFPASIPTDIVTLESFLSDLRELSADRKKLPEPYYRITFRKELGRVGLLII